MKLGIQFEVIFFEFNINSYQIKFTADVHFWMDKTLVQFMICIWFIVNKGKI